MGRVISLLTSLYALFYAAVLFPLVTMVFSSLGVLHYLLRKNRQGIDLMSVQWCRTNLWLLGCQVQEVGQENIPQGSCLWLFTHTSFADIWALKLNHPELRFGAKMELFSIPFFGAAMRAAGMLPIMRQQRQAVMKVYQDAIERTRLGEQFALAPEGGRAPDEKLLPFKSGPFIFAIQAQIPVVPVVIRGASGVWGKGQLLPSPRRLAQRTIQVQFLAPISTQGLRQEDRHSLIQQVRQRMLEFYPDSQSASKDAVQ
jgi:1-acyl-sn-glycerol-3-phosphate acyltransferase